MARTLNWFGTGSDAELILAWLSDRGATLVGGGAITFDELTDGKEFPVQFPSIGPVEFWPTDIEMPRVGDNSQSAKRAILASISQGQHPGRPRINVDGSAVAGVRLPEFRDVRYWIGGQVWFPTARLHETFPELNRICQALDRFLGKHPTVYDNREGKDQAGFERQLCMSGALQKFVALPEAFELLRAGAFMVDQLASADQYAEFRRRLQSSGHVR